MPSITSRVVGIRGRVVTTQTGSQYCLVGRASLRHVRLVNADFDDAPLAGIWATLRLPRAHLTMAGSASESVGLLADADPTEPGYYPADEETGMAAHWVVDAYDLDLTPAAIRRRVAEATP